MKNLNSKLLLTLFAIISFHLSFGQWNQVGGDIECFVGGNTTKRSEVTSNAIGNVIAVSSRDNNNQYNDAGLTKVFEEVNGQWLQKGDDIPGINPYTYSGTAIALNDEGNIIAIGATEGEDYMGNSTGVVRVYIYENNSWNLLGSPIEGEYTNDLFGSSVALSSDGFTIVIGAPQNDGHVGFLSPDDPNDNQGQVSVYKYINYSWTLLGDRINGGENGNLFGTEVAINNVGNRIIASGIGYQNSKGVVKVFELNESSWFQKGNAIIGEGELSCLGRSVDLDTSGNTIIIGSLYHDFNYRKGSAKVYNYIDNSWQQKGNSVLGNFNDDILGYSASINADGSIIAVGAPGLNESSGYIKVLSYINNDWISDQGDITGINSYDNIGASICLNQEGNRLVYSSFSNNDNSIQGYTKVIESIHSSILENIEKSITQIYPNPCYEKINVESEDIILSIKITDYSGREIKQYRNINQFTKSMDLSDINNGLFLVHIITKNTEEYIKIVVQ